MDPLTTLLRQLSLNIIEMWNQFIIANNQGSRIVILIDPTPPQSQASDEYDVILNSPLIEDIHNFPLPPYHKASKFKMFNGKQDLKQHLISFQ